MNRKTAIVTGGSRGIGRAAAELLATSGYNVVFSYRNSESEAKALVSRIRDMGGEAVCFPYDGEQCADAEALSAFSVRMYGRIDLLVNNAGCAARALLTDMGGDEIRAVAGADLLGAIYMSRAAASRMIPQQSGTIVNISSVHGVSGAAMEAVYSAAKAGIIGFTRAYAKELAPSGVRVNCVAPGVVDTDMNRFLDEDERRVLALEIPLRRFGTPEEIATGILFLAEHPYITGQTLVIDGGMT